MANKFTREDLLSYFDAMASRTRAVMVQKNHDYAGASGDDPFGNFEIVEQAGLVPTAVGILVRMFDKMKRLVTFVTSGKLLVPGEGFGDACDDLFVYAVILRAWLQHGHAPVQPDDVEPWEEQ